MISISIQEIEQNLAEMPEDQKVIAQEAIDSLSDEQLDSMLIAFGVDLLDEGEGEEEDILLDDVEDIPMEEEPILEEDVPAPVAEPTMEEAMAERPPPMATPIQDEMQALALGDMVDPAAAQQMAVPPEMAGGEAPIDPDAMAAEVQGEYDGLNGEMAGLIQQEGASETGVEDDVVVDEAKAGDYIINAAAVKRVGVQDLEERILEPAIKRLNKRGINITLASLKSPSDQIQNADDTENVDIAVSNGEYYIPDVLAGEIGYDLLDKINKRGEKETEEKLAEEEPAEGAVPAEAAPVEEAAPPEASAEQAMLQGFNSGGKVDNSKIKKKIRTLENAPLEKEINNPKNLIFAKKLGGEKFKTLGFGHSLKNEKNSIKIFQKLWPEADAKAIANGSKGITKEQALQLFDYDFAEKEKDVIRHVGQDRYLKLPEVARSAFLNAHFRGDFWKQNKKKKTVKQNWVNLVLKGNYEAASVEILNHQEYKTTKFRGIKKRLEGISSDLANFGIERTTHLEDLSSIPDTPPPTQDQSFMNTANPAIGSPPDIEENRRADEQGNAAVNQVNELRQNAADQSTATR